MNATRIGIFSLIVFFILLVLTLPDPEVAQDLKKIKLPWHITQHEDGTTEVIDIHLGKTNLQSVNAIFHEAEEIAIYLGKEKLSLEAYFGTIKLGLLEAKLVTTLDIGQLELEQMLSRAKGLAMSSSADRKIKIADQDIATALSTAIASISFIPKYSGLEAEFFKERFGEPDAWIRLNENAVQYFYPSKGLSILIDAKGKEVLEYTLPNAFKMPEEVIYIDNK